MKCTCQFKKGFVLPVILDKKNSLIIEDYIFIFMENTSDCEVPEYELF